MGLKEKKVIVFQKIVIDMFKEKGTFSYKQSPPTLTQVEKQEINLKRKKIVL